MRSFKILLMLLLVVLVAGCTVYRGPGIQVSMKGGTVDIPDYFDYSPYMPVKFYVPKDDCTGIDLRAYESNYYAKFQVCYKNNVLTISPQSYDDTIKTYPIKLCVTSLWESGFEYRNISSAGYPYLKNVTINVKQNNVENKNSGHRHLNSSLLSSATS